MTIILTGGGSGGHITPILAVAAELKAKQPDNKIIYIGQTGDSLADIPAQDPNIDAVYTIRAGKLRRYHNEGMKQLLDLPTVYKNTRDVFYTLFGIYQSWRLMKRLTPDVVFSRGGFVSVPVALGAKLRHVPYITHDSDPIPSLANRLIARWASLHAVALPKDIYPYPPAKTVTTGIPISDKFEPVNTKLMAKYRTELKVPPKAKLLFIVGGGLGSQTVNRAVAAVMPHLMKDFNDLYVVHGVGRANEAAMTEFYENNLSRVEQRRVRVYGYISDLYRFSGAADVIITRAGATNLAEFALQGKACIVIPSSFLVGGHQLKNAEYLEEQAAALVLNEDDLVADPNRLAKQLSEVLKDQAKQQLLSHKLASFAVPAAANKLADLILEIGTSHAA